MRVVLNRTAEITLMVLSTPTELKQLSAVQSRTLEEIHGYGIDIPESDQILGF
jgi:hypothetical protein